MSDEKIFESPASDPDDAFWLEQGKKMVEDSIKAVRDAAKAMMSGLGLLQGIYLAILGFMPKAIPLNTKACFILPLLFWFIALFACLRVMMTKRLNIVLASPDDIRKKSETVLIGKQRALYLAFAFICLGLLTAFNLVLFKLKI